MVAHHFLIEIIETTWGMLESKI